VFELHFNERIKKIEFTVFDRWGEILFNTTDLNFAWDGTYNGQPLPMGVYSYKLMYSDDDGNIDVPLFGHITLLK
jgi:gliding motility-associated-like protein